MADILNKKSGDWMRDWDDNENDKDVKKPVLLYEIRLTNVLFEELKNGLNDKHDFINRVVNRLFQ